MIWQAESGGKAIMTISATTKKSHTKSGMRPSVIPLQRMQTVVTMIFIDVAMLPIPPRSSDSDQ